MNAHTANALPACPVLKPFTQALTLPFDTLHAQYAQAARLGLVERSMLAEREFLRGLGALENLTLGLWARHN